MSAAGPCWRFCGRDGPGPRCLRGSRMGRDQWLIPCLLCGRDFFPCQGAGALICSTECRWFHDAMLLGQWHDILARLAPARRIDLEEAVAALAEAVDLPVADVAPRAFTALVRQDREKVLPHLVTSHVEARGVE